MDNIIVKHFNFNNKKKKFEVENVVYKQIGDSHVNQELRIKTHNKKSFALKEIAKELEIVMGLTVFRRRPSIKKLARYSGLNIGVENSEVGKRSFEPSFGSSAKKCKLAEIIDQIDDDL